MQLVGRVSLSMIAWRWGESRAPKDNTRELMRRSRRRRVMTLGLIGAQQKPGFSRGCCALIKQLWMMIGLKERTKERMKDDDECERRHSNETAQGCRGDREAVAEDYDRNDVSGNTL